MKVSIVIPVYNAEKYLAACIQSAISQTYGNIEVIAVNDGSTDNSLDILHRFSDKIIIINKKNGGTATALNAGINAMTGDWFKWLSADDILHSNAIETLVDYVSKFRNAADSYIFYTNYDIIDENGNKLREYIEPNYNNLTNFERNIILLDHFIGNGITSFISKLTFNKVGLFSETIGFQEDYEFWLRCCLLNDYTLHLLPKITAQYRTHSEQLTKTKMNESFSKSQIIRQQILNQLDPNIQERYVTGLKKWKHTQYPLHVRFRRKVRDAILKSLPSSLSNKILSSYLKIKKL
jgi:glycosyltransferase involved in cell wall biosynthesis